MSNISVSLNALVEEHLTLARKSASGRSSALLVGGHDWVLQQVLTALPAGQSLAENFAPGELTLQVIRGRVNLVNDAGEREGSTGDLIVVPSGPHSFEALEDSALLMTIVGKGWTRENR